MACYIDFTTPITASILAACFFGRDLFVPRTHKSYSYGSHGFQTTDDGYDHRQDATSTQSRVIWCCSCTTLRVFLGPTPDINHTLGVPCVYGCTSDATTNPPRAQKLRSRTINGYRYDRGRVWRLSLCPYRAAATPSPSLRMRWRLIATGGTFMGTAHVSQRFRE